MPRLQDKITFITGGGTGIGRATAELFYEEGANLFLVGRREDLLREVSELTHASYVDCDISEEDQIISAVERAIGQYGRIDILVNNAGVLLDGGPLEELDLKVLYDTFSVNVAGTLMVSKYALREMNRGGSVVNVSSIFWVVGANNMVAYTASKGAIISATRAMAIEYASKGIRVNCISPSVTETEMIRGLFDKNPQLEEVLVSSHPLGYVASPKDVAQSILYLASDESRFVTGQNLVLDGGRSIKG